MADQEGTGNSVATSSPTPLINWWDLHATSLSSWNNNSNGCSWTNQPNPDSNSSSCCEDQDMSVSTSLTNASNHSTLTVVESPRHLIELSAASSTSLMAEQPSDNHLWSQVLLGVGSNEELQHSQVGENFIDALSSKTMTSVMYEPACNYLKKLDTSWEYNNNSSSFNSFDQKHFNNGFNEAMLESERLSKLSNLVGTWSIAPPDPQVNNNNNNDNNNPQFDPQTQNNNTVTLSSSIEHSGFLSSCGLDMNVKQEHHHGSEVSEGLFGRSCTSMMGCENGFSYGMPSLSSCSKNLTEVISFTGRMGRPVMGIHALKPSLRSVSVSSGDSKKQGFQTSLLPSRANNGRGQGSIIEVKKKRTDDSSEAILKKPKQETSTASSTKVQAPKVKLGDKITTLQQIVSPFGKTDTASVLFEAIGYIKFLQEQVQLLSNSYMKATSHKETWGSMDHRKEVVGDENVDLRSRGLCLVPISYTPQVYRDNTGPDYWTPAYRGCLYR